MSAPTTAEVRAEIAHEQRLGVGSLNSRCAALKHYALPIAEHRDALAAVLRTLTETAVEHLRDDDCVDCGHRLTACTCGHPMAVAIAAAQAALAAKGAGR